MPRIFISILNFNTEMEFRLNLTRKFNLLSWTHISGELFEGVEHVEAMKVDDACCQRIIMSEHHVEDFHMTRKYRGQVDQVGQNYHKESYKQLVISLHQTTWTRKQSETKSMHVYTKTNPREYCRHYKKKNLTLCQNKDSIVSYVLPNPTAQQGYRPSRVPTSKIKRAPSLR